MQYVNLPCANGVVTVAGTVGVAPVPVLKLVGVVAVVGEDSIKNMKYSAYKKNDNGITIVHVETRMYFVSQYL